MFCLIPALLYVGISRCALRCRSVQAAHIISDNIIVLQHVTVFTGSSIALLYRYHFQHWSSSGCSTLTNHQSTECNFCATVRNMERITMLVEWILTKIADAVSFAKRTMKIDLQLMNNLTFMINYR